ncbi:MAG: Ig-like domain-containing protein [Anaerolineales bacterium]
MTNHKFTHILNRLFYPLLRVAPLVALLLAASQLIYGVEVARGSPVLIATKADSLVVDIDEDNQTDPSDTIRYTTVLTNSGVTNAANVHFMDTIDANTTLDPGSTRSTPIARNDQYASLGNVGISVPATSGVLVNDNDPDSQAVSAIAAGGATANGGTFSISTDGAFSYLPPTGFEGTDSFNYFIQDADSNQDPATVFVVVTEMIWFIDNSAASPGDGRLMTPFNSLSSYNATAADDPGDSIFLHSGSGAYTGGIALQNDQLLIGQGSTASLETITGISLPPFSNALPTTGGARPVLTTISGDGVLLGQNNTLRGFNVGNTAGVGISDSGGTVGTLTISEVAISGTGGGIEVDNGGTLAVTLDSLSASSSSDEGVDLENVSGSFALIGTSGTLNMSGVPAIVIDGNPSLNINTLSFQSVGSTNAAHGISIRDTTGSLSITGTGTTDGSGGTLQNITGSGVHLENATNISLANMNINFTAQSPPVVTGSPTCDDEDSGTNTGCVAAVHMVNASNVSLTNLTINDSNQHGIDGNNVSGLSVLNSTLTNIGDSTLENGLNFINLLGTVTFDNLSVDGSQTRNALIENNQGTATINVTNSTINNAVEEDGFLVIGGSNGGNDANINLNVTDSSFIHNHSVQLKAHAEDSSTVDVNITGNTFDGEPTVVGNVGIDLAAVDMGTLTFDVIGTLANPQTFQPFRSHAINVFASGGGTATGRVNGNTVLGSSFGAGVRAVAQVTDINGFNPSITIEIDGNTITDIQGAGLAGIHIVSRDGTSGLSGTANVQATINNNNVTINGADSVIQAYLNGGNTMCLDVTNNVVAGASTSPFAGFGSTHYIGNPVAGDSLGAGNMTYEGYITNDLGTTWNNNGNSPTLAAGIAGEAYVDGTQPTNGTCSTPALIRQMDDRMVLTQTGHSLLRTENSVLAPQVEDKYQHPASTSSAMLISNFFTAQRDRVTELKARIVSFDLAALKSQANEFVSQLVDGLVSAFTVRHAYASGETVNLDLGGLNPGQVVVVTFDVTVDNPQDPITNSLVCNQGLFTGDNHTNVFTDDPGVGGVEDPTCTAIDLDDLEADLALTKSDTSDPVVVGDDVAYSLMVSNNGPDAADNIVLTDSLPGSTTFASAIPDQGSCDEMAGVVTCNLGILAGNDSAGITITATTSVTGTLTNNASVTSDTLDPHATNNSASEDTAVTLSLPQADLSMTKVDALDPVTVGETITYTLTVNNNGPDAAQSVILTDTLPGSATFVSATPDQGLCDELSGLVTCSLGDILKGGGTSVEIVVTTTLTGTLTNNANVTAGTVDPNPADNNDSETTTVEPVGPEPTFDIYLPIVVRNP